MAEEVVEVAKNVAEVVADVEEMAYQKSIKVGRTGRKSPPSGEFCGYGEGKRRRKCAQMCCVMDNPGIKYAAIEKEMTGLPIVQPLMKIQERVYKEKCFFNEPMRYK